MESGGRSDTYCTKDQGHIDVWSCCLACKVEERSERIAELEGALDAARTFAKSMFDASCRGEDVDGGTIQELLIDVGMAEAVEGGFNPKIDYDESGWAKPGDTWYMLTWERALRGKGK
jgi:hypothetical protein